MTTVYSLDGSTVTRRYRDTPPPHWVPTGPYTGRFVPADTTVGYFPLVEADRPADTEEQTHEYSVERDGDRFVERWTARPWSEAERASRIEAESYVDPAEQVAVLADLMVAAEVRAGGLTDAEIEKRAPLFPSWKPGIQVEVGQVYRWDGTLFEVIQSHPTQSDWEPDKVPALFRSHRVAGAAPEPWEQRGSTNPYMIDDPVLWTDGNVYKSTINNNTWSPATYPAGWTRV